jgi:plastocyanin
LLGRGPSAKLEYVRTGLRFVATLVLFAACSGDSAGPDTVATVTVTGTTQNIIVGESTQLNATARDASGSVVQSPDVTWNTSSAAIAGVSLTGLVSGFAPGPVTITATIAGVSGSMALVVNPNPAGSATVQMPGFSFSPFSTTINVGGTVIFDFPAEPHNVIFADVTGAPESIQATSNRRVPRTFLVAGDFPYDCRLHPGMSGIVLVR